jgi:hypothetical protein
MERRVDEMLDQGYVRPKGQKGQFRREIHVLRLRKRKNTPNVMEIKRPMFGGLFM